MVKLTKIYTRTGDDGTTGLVDGSRRAKHDPRMVAIGVVDEANSALGLAAVALAGTGHADMLFRIQNDLFDLGADIATPGEDFAPGEMTLRIVPQQVEWLEQAIDTLNARLEPLSSFVLPGGSEAAARVHVARATARARGCSRGTAAGLPVRFDFPATHLAEFLQAQEEESVLILGPRHACGRRKRVEMSVSRSLALRRRARSR